MPAMHIRRVLLCSPHVTVLHLDCSYINNGRRLRAGRVPLGPKFSSPLSCFSFPLPSVLFSIARFAWEDVFACRHFTQEPAPGRTARSVLFSRSPGPLLILSSSPLLSRRDDE